MQRTTCYTVHCDSPSYSKLATPGQQDNPLHAARPVRYRAPPGARLRTRWPRLHSTAATQCSVQWTATNKEFSYSVQQRLRLLAIAAVLTVTTVQFYIGTATLQWWIKSYLPIVQLPGFRHLSSSKTIVKCFCFAGLLLTPAVLSDGKLQVYSVRQREGLQRAGPAVGVLHRAAVAQHSSS